MPNVKVILYREREIKEIKVEKGTKIVEILTKIGLNPVEVVVALDNVIVPEEERIYSDSILEVLPVVSGG
ncbi:MAG TPA: MoaD/ThiS family protein [Thermofilum sp.]|nr:MoaD/ThiS family protein [Thermofilum sp.]